MPTYTYRCQKCGEEFERFQSMSDEPVKRCPTCKGKVQRVFHPVGIVLKGSGFHKTDYRSKESSAERAAGEGKSGSSDKASDSKSSDSKSSDSKSSDSKSSGTKSSETKSSEKKSSGAKSKDD